MSHYIRIVPLVKRAVKLLRIMGDDDLIYIFAHMDADGISSASIIAELLRELGKPFTIRFLRQIRRDILEELVEEFWPYNIIFLDMGSGQLHNIARIFRRAARVIIIDHHIIQKKPNFVPFKLQLMNLRLVNINGGYEVSTSSTAYLLARAFFGGYPNLKELVKPAIVGAIGDNQDVGPRRSLIGLNKYIVEEGKSFEIVNEKIDLILPGKSTKPVYQALADIYTPIIPGITGSPEGTYKLLVSMGVLKDEITYRLITWDDLSDNHKRKIFEIIAQRLIASGKMNMAQINNLLLGTIYEFPKEKKGIKRDARELAILLNATARLGKPWLGLATLLGDTDAEARSSMILKRYHNELSIALRKAYSLLKKDGRMALIDGRNKIKEEYISVVSSIMAKSVNDVDIIVGIATSEKGLIKLSIRRPVGSRIKNVEQLILKAISGIKGASGGGHEEAGGAFVPEDKIDVVLTRFKRLLRES